MKLVPNMFLVNVTDMDRSRKFYESIFDLEAAFAAPAFVAFPIAEGVMFALQGDWNPKPDGARPNSELVMNVTASDDAIDQLFESWTSMGATTVDAPHQMPFGYTFVVADPDGNLIRVAPEDE